MSLLQCSVYAHWIVVAADTATEWFAPGSEQELHPVTDTSKLVAIPHIPAVVAGRGSNFVVQTMLGHLSQAPDLGTFLGGVAEVAEQAVEMIAKSEASVGAAYAMETEVIVAGWCSQAGRLRAFHGVKPEAGRFTFEEIAIAAYAPLPYSDGTQPMEPKSTEDRVALARRQVERIRGESDGVAGGDLTVATLTKDAVQLELVRSFA